MKLPKGGCLPTSIIGLALLVACNTSEGGSASGACLIDCTINDDMKKQLDDTKMLLLEYQDMYKAAISLDTNNERCNDLRRFLIDQLPQDGPSAYMDSNYLFRFHVHAFFGKCLVKDNKHNKIYAITTENIDTAMFLDKNHDLRIPSIEIPE